MRRILEKLLGTKVANGITTAYRLSQLWYLLPIVFMAGGGYFYYKDISWVEVKSYAGSFFSDDEHLKPAIGYDLLGEKYPVKHHVNQEASLLNVGKICRLRSENPNKCRAIPAKIGLFYATVLRTGGGFGYPVFFGESVSKKIAVLKAQRKCNKSKSQDNLIASDCEKIGPVIQVK